MSTETTAATTAGTPATSPEDPVEEVSADDFSHARTLDVDHDWYKRAVFYEVLVRAFNDSNRDGTGDLRGLTEKLDYLQWLGVDCLWLPPFYDSPLRDGGYDIRDFRTVLPEFGTVEDFVTLLDEAHKRGIRVITDLVMNHTSDTHPWFEESRRHPEGPYGDFYMWEDDDSRYPEARIIFVDTEQSNWTYDPVRGQFYWHRFFSHQPDLNYDCPAVQEAMLDVLRFWLDLGIDGFRLDAVPYLYARDGTNCENLPETHAFLRRCRKVLEDEYPGRVHARRGQPVAVGRRGVLRRPRGRRRRVPHGLPLPADAAHLHGGAAGEPLPDLGDPGADARDPVRARSGASSCATTTSSRSRWSPTKSATTCTRSTPRTRG